MCGVKALEAWRPKVTHDAVSAMAAHLAEEELDYIAELAADRKRYPTATLPGRTSNSRSSSSNSS